MTALGTNILIRYLTAGDAKQLAAAEELIDQALRDREPFFVPAIVLCELVWVLARRYDQSKSQIVQTLERILDMDQFRIEYDAMIRRGLKSFETAKGISRTTSSVKLACTMAAGTSLRSIAD